MNPDVPRVEAINPSTLLKSRKTEAELANVRQAMEQDGAALCEFFAWFEGALGKERITELTIDEQITAARARRPGYVRPSFATIAGFNANGAMPHYRATAESHAVIEGDGLLLIDSGGQYLGGTTDITRVVAVGAPSADQKVDFTLVLGGHDRTVARVLPARHPVADAGRHRARADLGRRRRVRPRHGSRRGLFPERARRPAGDFVPRGSRPAHGDGAGHDHLQRTGIYRPPLGVRIENLVANRSWLTSELGEFLCFETLTLCPIDTRCIEPSLLRDDERAWLNDYHKTVFERLSPLVEGDALAWLTLRCKEVTQRVPPSRLRRFAPRRTGKAGSVRPRLERHCHIAIGRDFRTSRRYSRRQGRRHMAPALSHRVPDWLGPIR